MINVLLSLLFLFSIVYCCNLPLLIDWPIFICDKESMLYDVAIGIISAYIFYVIQILLPKLINKFKYRKLILQKLHNIKYSMKKTVEIISGTENYSVDKTDIITEIEIYLNKSYLFNDGASVYKNSIELVIIDALADSENKVHTEIMELISLNVIDEKTLDMMLKIEKLGLRDFVRPLSLNKEGNLITKKQEKGESYGGYMGYNKDYVNKEIIKNMYEYIEVFKEFVEFVDKCSHKIF